MDDALEQLHRKILALKKAAEALLRAGEEIPAVLRNVERIRASIKMLELGVCDVVELVDDAKSDAANPRK